jgi:hypothetical protein
MSYRIDPVIDKAIYDWVVLISQIGVVWDMQDVYDTLGNARLARPFIVLTNGPIRNITQGQMRYVSLDKWNWETDSEFDILIQIFSNQDGHLRKIQDLRDSLKFDKTNTLLRTAGVSFLRAEPINDISAFLSTQHEYRASFMATFMYRRLYAESITQFNIANISYTLTAGSNTHSGEINVP